LDLQTNGTTAISISASQVVTFANQPAYTGGTANGVLYLNGSKVVTTGSALVFDGANLGVGTASPDDITTNYTTVDVRGSVGGGLRLGVAGGNNMAIYASATTSVIEASGSSALQFVTNAAERMRLDSTGQLQMFNSSNTAINALRGSVFGYSTSYQALIIGATSGTVTPCLNVDPSGNASGAFSGNGGEVMFRNGASLITPNSANTAFFPVLTFDANGYGFKARTNIGVGDATPASSGGGITFPATQLPSSDANTLDDYEEGTWTPAMNLLGTVTYGTQYGKYQKIGKYVHVLFTIVVVSTDTIQDSSVMLITGLPFTVGSSPGSDYGNGSTCLLTENMRGVASSTAPTTFHVLARFNSTELTVMQNNYNSSIASSSYFSTNTRAGYRGGTMYVIGQFRYEASA
jgi:hypothetical protein